MEALKSYNFADAQLQFQKALKKETAGASYGLSVLYGINNNPFFQLDSAYKYIIQADSLYPKLTDKEKEVLLELKISDSAIVAHKQVISSQFYQLISNSNSQADFDSFLVWHPWAMEFEEAKTIRNELAFREAMSINTYQAFALFMERYPNADERSLAQKKYDELFFTAKTSVSSVRSYQQFIQEHPDSPYKRHAEEMVYNLTVKPRNETNLVQFIRESPDNHLIGVAWKQLYEFRIQTFTPEEVTEFLLDYADYPFRDEAMADVARSKQWYIPVKDGENWGYIDSNGQWLIEPCYEWAEPFSEGKALVYQNDLAGFINKRGEWIVPCVYEDAYSYSGSRAVVESTNGFGVISYLGDTILDPVYGDLGVFSGGMIYASVDDKYGYFDKDGALSVSFKYDLAFDFKGNYAIVKKDQYYGMIDQTGELVLPTEFSKILLTNDSLAVVEQEEKYGLFHLNGDTLIPLSKDYIGLFHDQLALVIEGENYGYINSSGDTVISLNYDVTSETINYADFKEGHAKYQYKGKFGLIDSIGERVYPAIFEDVGTFSYPYTAVKKRGKWGYADTEVNLKIKYQYDFAWPFKDSLAIVEVSGKQGVIDVNGNYIVEPLADEVSVYSNLNSCKVLKEGKVGIVSSNGDTLIPIINTHLEILTPHIWRIEQAGAMAIYHLKEERWIYRESGFEWTESVAIEPETE